MILRKISRPSNVTHRILECITRIYMIIATHAMGVVAEGGTRHSSAPLARGAREAKDRLNDPAYNECVFPGAPSDIYEVGMRGIHRYQMWPTAIWSCLAYQSGRSVFECDRTAFRNLVATSLWSPREFTAERAAEWTSDLLRPEMSRFGNGEAASVPQFEKRQLVMVAKSEPRRVLYRLSYSSNPFSFYKRVEWILPQAISFTQHSTKLSINRRPVRDRNRYTMVIIT